MVIENLAFVFFIIIFLYYSVACVVNTVIFISDYSGNRLLFIRGSADGSRRFENLYESSRLFDWIFCLQEVHFRQMQATIYMIR